MLTMDKTMLTLLGLSPSIYISLKNGLGKINCCVPKMPVGFRDKIYLKIRSFPHMVVPLKLVSLRIWPSTELLLCFPLTFRI